MGKSWPFRKKNHDGEVGSSCGGKKLQELRYVPVELARQLWETNWLVPSSDASLPDGGWYLNSRLVSVPSVLHAGRVRYEVGSRRFILPSNLREEPAFDLNSYSWIMFGTWEFDPRRRAGYLGDVRFFKREFTNALTNNNRDDEVNNNEEGAEEADDHEDDGFDDDDAAWDTEHQPQHLT
ncbi:hypothetical protein QYE76_069505 [Lolium multiflorum]|uniref:Uncharacterized protein n=1 Tax=Lolium multiflorum TaxID=4521 RepID=A0AAD8SGC8_LOLMU|nr:hypothetical protein QYE76_069505 [Lolium multiflorum]